MMRLLFIAVLALACLGCEITKKNDAPIERYKIHGSIQKLDEASHAATIKHEDIKGYMDAMTMEFTVKDRSEFSKLRVGEVIDGTVFVQDGVPWVGEISESKQPATSK